MEKKVKLQMGCGHQRLAGWINVDSSRSCKPDLVDNLTKPFPFNLILSIIYIQRIFSIRSSWHMLMFSSKTILLTS